MVKIPFARQQHTGENKVVYLSFGSGIAKKMYTKLSSSP